MKLNKENYELIMFDLLEGNLPSAESDEILAQIQNDAFYRSEWILFQSTILKADNELSYKHKDSLIRHETKVIPLRNWISVAVAACFIIALFIFIPRKASDNKVVKTPEAIEKNQNNIADKENTEQITSPELNNNSLVEDKINVGVNTTNDHMDSSIPIEVELAPETPSLLVNDITNTLESKVLSTNLTDTSKLFEPLIAGNEPIDDFLDHSVTSSVVSRISNKVIHSIYMVSKPKMRIEPNWKERNFKIELETTGYYATASVNPFKR